MIKGRENAFCIQIEGNDVGKSMSSLKCLKCSNNISCMQDSKWEGKGLQIFNNFEPVVSLCHTKEPDL